MFTGGVAATMKKGAELQLANMAIITDYVFGRRGPLAVPAGIEVLAFVNTPFVNASLDYPDVEIVLMSVSPSSDEGERYLIDTGLTRELAPIINRPKSKGHVRLRSADPDEAPVIDPRYLTHPDDIHVAVQGEWHRHPRSSRKRLSPARVSDRPFRLDPQCGKEKKKKRVRPLYSRPSLCLLEENEDEDGAKAAVQIIRSKAFKKLGARLWTIPFPACKAEGAMWSEPYLACLARHHTCTTWHPCCTCPLGEHGAAIIRSKAFKKLGARLWTIPFPACKAEGAMWSEPYLACLARHHTCTTWHPCCTCPLGEHGAAVVDSRLRVRGGVTGLRVIDASVMPSIVTANLNAPTYMIAEKGAAMIREDHDPSPSGLLNLIG
ncbi:hypothetical protein HPB47_011582 [Ixodes persulcatus]|uniref:Uncharacterized protein n=1 Tax=Ixodes persulcatus TaxID=34615 RepID=A0AC60NVX6_IXOPE|nr:hypothetical protein HPB47_011582 [Ixodes persulcatus]